MRTHWEHLGLLSRNVRSWFKALTILSWLGSHLSSPNLRQQLVENNISREFQHKQQVPHKISWKQYEDVDNLRNDDIVVFILSATTDSGHLPHDRLVSSSRTWMRMLKHVVVVVEDTFEVRFSMRHCLMTEYDGQYTTFKCHNEPTYLLTRRCGTKGLDNIAVGCKVDDSVNYLVNLRKDLFDHVKYTLISADDIYWRADQLLRWLAEVERSGASNFPVVFSPTPNDQLRHGVRDMTNCGEIYTSWQSYPVIVNRALLQRMSAGAAAYAVREICRSFDASSAMGMGILAWMHSADHIHMPNVNWHRKALGTGELTPTDMAVMLAEHSQQEHCSGDRGSAEHRSDWPASARYNQSTVLGCGDLGAPAPGHNAAQRANMYDVWEYFSSHGLDISINQQASTEFTEYYVAMKAGRVTKILYEANTWVSSIHNAYKYTTGRAIDHAGGSYTPAHGEHIVKRRMPRMTALRGYAATKHGKSNTITNVWKAFTPQDCSPAGHKKEKL